MTIYLGTNLLAGSFKTGASWEVGDIGQAALGINESLNKRRYLNGQVISQTQFAQFTAWLKQRVSVYPSLATSEADWQTAVTNSDLGQCGQFVIDDVNSTIRLPKVVNLQGLMDLTHLGETVEAGLPNIEGTLQNQSLRYDYQTDIGGAFQSSSTGTTGIGANTGGYGTILNFSAQDSNSIYGNSTTVQPESIQYPYFIQVAEGIENSVDVSREIELSNPFSLLDYKFSEYEITNASWLRSNGQYNSGTTYADVYNLLLQIYNGTVTKAGVSVKLSTETYADTDFVLNTSDTTFRLPLKVALASGKAVAGNGMTLGLTDGTNNTGLVSVANIGLSSRNNVYGESTGISNSGSSLDTFVSWGITTDPTKSGIETSANGLYLYFYVGAVVQDASVIAAASVLTQIAELLSCDYVVESKVATAEDPSWYRVYKSGWVEQGGYFSDTSNGVWAITLLKPYTTSNYYISGIADNHANVAGSFVMIDQNTQTTTGFTIRVNYTGTAPSTKTLRWEAKGQGA